MRRPHGIFPSAAHQRTDARLDLRPDRHRVHHGVRHHRHDQFRPWRYFHGRRVCRAHRLSHPRRDRRHRDPGRAVPGAADRHGPHRAVRFGGRAPGLSAAASFVPAGAADFRDRHVDHPAELRASGPGRPGQAAAAVDPGRPYLDRERYVRGADFQHSGHHHRDNARIDAGVLGAGRQHAARPGHAGLRTGFEDGGFGRRRYRPHHLAHVRGRRRARRRGRHHVPALLRRDRFLHRLRGRREGVHRRRARRHGLAPGRHAGRPLDRADRDVLVRLFLDRVQGRRRVFGPGRRPHLPADRHSRPAGGRESLKKRGARVIEAADISIRPARNIADALKSAARTALVAFGLFALLIGLRTDQGPSGALELMPRWTALAIIVALAFAGGLVRALTFGDRTIELAGHVPEGLKIALGRAGRWAAPALLVFALLTPVLFYDNRYLLDLGILILTSVMLGWGLNIVVGLAGLLDLGYVAFYAVGAYSYALLAQNFGWSFWICLPVAGCLAASWGVLLGFPVLRLRGDYLAIVTLAFGEIIRLVLINWVPVTNGYAGITGVPRPTFFGIPFNANDDGFAARFGLEFSPIYRTLFLYYVILALALLTNWVTIRLRRLPLGRAWEALREDEVACRSLGINTTNTKLTAFAMGAMFAGFAGSFFAARQGFISPESFTFLESATILSIVVLGGMGSQIGVAVAAVAMIGGTEIMRELDFLKYIFGDDFDPTQYRMLLFGFAMVLIMIWKPRGLVGTREPSAFYKERRTILGSMVKEGHG